MANVKKLWTKTTTGSTVYVIVRREVDSYLLNDAGGDFASAPADPYVSLTENTVIKSLYELSESRVAWEPGQYKSFFYRQVGGSPVPASDTLLEVTDFYVVGDRVVVNFPYEYGKVVTHASNGANTFKTDLLNPTSDYCVGSFVKFVSGNLVEQTRRITAFSSSAFITVSTSFTETPAGDDEFFLVNQ